LVTKGHDKEHIHKNKLLTEKNKSIFAKELIGETKKVLRVNERVKEG